MASDGSEFTDESELFFTINAMTKEERRQYAREWRERKGLVKPKPDFAMKERIDAYMATEYPDVDFHKVSRKHNIVLVRAIYACLLFYKAKFGVSRIGELLGKEHSQICYYTKNFFSFENIVKFEAYEVSNTAGCA